MKALLYKDLAVLYRSSKMLFVMIVIFALIPAETGFSFGAFAVVYAAMVPYTAVAYDESSHWDTYAAMLPYRTRDLVLSKYILGWLAVGGAALLTLALVLGRALLLQEPPENALSVLAGGLLAGLLMLAVTTPAVLRWGPQKGRLFTIGLLVILFAVALPLGQALGDHISADVLACKFPMALLAFAVLVILVLQPVSIALACRWYKAKMR